MGFPREQCLAALTAAFGNSERAVEYLLNGVPPSPMQGHSQAASMQAGLQNLPQLAELRTLLQNNPDSLPQIVAQLSQTSPELYNVLLLALR